MQIVFRVEHTAQCGGHDGGKYSGLQPAITALAARACSVGTIWRGGTGRVGAVVAAQGFDELRHLGLGGDEDGHAVAPALLDGKFVEGIDIHVTDVDHFLFGDVLHLLVASGQSPWSLPRCVPQLFGIQAADGVLHYDQTRLDLAGFRLGQDQRLESFSGDHESGDAELLEFEAVVETPR